LKSFLPREAKLDFFVLGGVPFFVTLSSSLLVIQCNSTQRPVLMTPLTRQAILLIVERLCAGRFQRGLALKNEAHRNGCGFKSGSPHNPILHVLALPDWPYCVCLGCHLSPYLGRRIDA
jgi:hypothetical protein